MYSSVSLQQLKLNITRITSCRNVISIYLTTSAVTFLLLYSYVLPGYIKEEHIYNCIALTEGFNGVGGGGGGGGDSTFWLSVTISFLCRLSVKIFHLCRLSVNLS